MSKDLLIELQKECMELGAAGSELGRGNIKLQKLLPKFEKLGQKIKPFKMVADRLNMLINSKKGESEDNLSSLLSLVNAILAAQAETDIEGEIEQVQGTSGEINSNVSSYLILPLVKALTTTGSGRYAVIEEVFEEEVFSDFRLIPLLVKGLDDKYGEIKQLCYEKLEAINNPSFLPLLQESFDPHGKKGDAIKLNLIGQILGGGGVEFYIDLLKDSSKEVKVQAIKILVNLDNIEEVLKDIEDVLVKYSKSGTKDIRKAAYCGLVKINSEKARKELKNAIKKANYDMVLEAISSYSSENYAEVLFAGLKHTYKKDSETDINKITDILNEIKNHKSCEIFQFLVECLKEDRTVNWKIYDSWKYPNIEYKGALSVERQICDCIGEYDNIPDEVSDLIESRKERNGSIIFDLAFKTSLKTRTPEEVYEIYSPYFINRTIDRELVNHSMYIFAQYLGHKAINFRGGGWGQKWYKNIPDTNLKTILRPVEKEFDKRWKAIFRECNAYEILAYTIDKEDTTSIEFLLSKVKEQIKKGRKIYNKKHLIDYKNCIIGLLKIGYEEIYEIILNEFKKPIDFNLMQEMADFIPYLPSKYVKELEKYLCDFK
jgi:hypothetical protein